MKRVEQGNVDPPPSHTHIHIIFIIIFLHNEPPKSTYNLSMNRFCSLMIISSITLTLTLIVFCKLANWGIQSQTEEENHLKAAVIFWICNFWHLFVRDIWNTGAQPMASLFRQWFRVSRETTLSLYPRLHWLATVARRSLFYRYSYTHVTSIIMLSRHPNSCCYISLSALHLHSSTMSAGKGFAD